MNLIKSNSVKDPWPQMGEQGWLNMVYLWEKFDIGTEYNMLASTVLKLGVHNYMHNSTIFQFLGPLKPDKCPMEEPWLAVCNKWNHYRGKLILDQSK